MIYIYENELEFEVEDLLYWYERFMGGFNNMLSDEVLFIKQILREVEIYEYQDFLIRSHREFIEEIIEIRIDQ